jgi:diaminohydroxyphosphoribosylaminopyrimidine deaminase/5-amino-6-(5-phosphoribosylamino)uracil reductase
MYSSPDIAWMRQALALARDGLYTTTPNPRVGCLIVREGRVVGQGAHLRAGEPHAEVYALREAREQARGATAYITLEPCNHIGRTGPCTQALVQAGIASVVVAMEDPNPRVSGQGLSRLRAAGIDVRCGLLAEEARMLNPGFISRMTRGRPWVRVKLASSLDGRVALASGASQWITDAQARDDGHHWRAQACVVATGMGTFLKDQPRLTVRAVETSRPPARLLLDPSLAADPDAPFFSLPQAWVATSLPPQAVASSATGQRLLARGVAFLHTKRAPVRSGEQPHRRPGLDLEDLLHQLALREVNELHLEAGPRLVGQFLSAGLADELLVYMAPVLLGEGLPLAFGIDGLATPNDAPRWKLHEAVAVGDGLRLRLLR